jgi:4-hydroxy-2-oxoglutarate aldolase
MRIQGVFAPVPTPFDGDGRLDTARFRTAFARWVPSPLTGFVVLGSNGEAVLLDEAESDLAIESARDSIPRGRPFIVGTGRESTDATVRASRRAAELGADAVLVRTPGFFKPQMTADAFVRHYTTVADASPIPVLLYNFMALTGVNLSVDAAAVLAAHPNIVGMKESGGDIGKMTELVNAVPPDFSVLAGSASTFHAALTAGARGGVLVVAAVVPGTSMKLYDAVCAGRHDEARALQRELMPLARLLSAHGVPALKRALNLIGCDVGVPRAPLAPLSDAIARTLRDALQMFDEIPAMTAESSR